MGNWKEFLERITGRRATSAARRIEREVEEEYAFHLEMRTRENIAAGMPEDEARSRARERLGEIGPVLRDARALRLETRGDALRRLLDEFGADLRFTLRGMRSAPTPTAVALLTLMLGIGATTAIFSVADGVLLEAFPYPDADRLVQVNSRALSEDTADTWRERLTSFEATTLYTIGSHEMVGPDGARRLSSIFADARFFDVLGVGAARGRLLTDDDERPGADRVAVITDRLWRHGLGADEDVLGGALRFDGTSATIVGILPPGLTFLRYPDADVFMPLQWSQRSPGMALGKLRTGASFEAARQQAVGVAESLGADPIPGSEAANVATLYDSVLWGARPPITILAGAVSLVLLIACVNVANLQVARALGRHDEIAVRIALGARRGRLVRQLMTESSVLAVAGGALGILCATWAVPALLQLGPVYMPRMENVAVDLRVVTFALAVSVGTGLLFGLAPVLFAGRLEKSAAAASSGRRGADSRLRSRLLQALVITEVALSLMLLIATAMTLRSFLELLPTTPGFDAAGKVLFEVRPPERRYPDNASLVLFHDRVAEELRALPGVTAVTSISSPPMIGMLWVVGAFPEGMAPDTERPPNVWLERASPNYHQVMGIDVMRGRALSDRPGGVPEMVISETAARRLWPDTDPLGKTLTLEAPALEFVVVGVAADTRRFGTDVQPRPTVWARSFDAPDRRMTFIAATAGEPRVLLEPAGDVVARIDPEMPLWSLQTMEGLLAESMDLPRFYAILMATFGGIAVLIASFGFFGVMAYIVGRRTHELGVRLAIGASPANVMAMILRQGLGMILAGTVIGVCGSLASARLLENLLFGFDPVEPGIYAGVVVLMTVIGLFACWLPAQRAMRVDPVDALRPQ